MTADADKAHRFHQALYPPAADIDTRDGFPSTRYLKRLAAIR